jgi:lipopolysaccharide/colanic/teichoic acid biosynthesis glycosyltransferase
MKRIFDLVFSSIGLFIFSPIILFACLGIYYQDKHSPFYIAKRTGKNGKSFNMIKLRSMIINAEKNKVDSTSSNDPRITKIGRFIRKSKLDELCQLFNVFIGEMSLVGPRPNVKRETDLYTKVEKNLLRVKPGITDFASIIFSDESEILKNVDDPDISYNQLIRPWKSRLGLFYIKKQSLKLDILIIIFTILSFFSRKFALVLVNKTLKRLNAPRDLCKLSLRKDKLKPTPPPGSNEIVISRET